MQQVQSPPKDNSEASALDLANRRKLFQDYKKKLLLQVILLLVICFCVILERIFYEVIVERESSIISNLQWSFGLLQKSSHQETDQYTPTGIKKMALYVFTYIGSFKIQMLLITHFFITLYVAVNAIIASKILYMTMLVIYGNSLLQIFYSGARPFWQTNTVFGSFCMSSYNHPSRGLIVTSFIVCYTIYCFTVKNKSKEEDGFNFKSYLIKFGIASLLLLIQLVNYLLGEQYLINIGLGAIYFITIFAFLVFLNASVDTIIKKSTIMTIDAKKYIFYWLLYLGIFQCFSIIVYESQNKFLDIDWIKNFINCLQYQNIGIGKLRYDEVVGAWFTFMESSVIFGLIGAVFGIAFAFRNIPKLEWYEGNKKKRLLRAAIANLLMSPSWLLVALFEKQQSDDSWIRKLGMNEFILDSLHFSVLYFVLFGLVPVYLFGRLLKLNNTEKDEFYVVLGDNQELQQPMEPIST